MYRRGAPPNFRVDPPSIVTHMYLLGRPRLSRRNDANGTGDRSVCIIESGEPGNEAD